MTSSETSSTSSDSRDILVLGGTGKTGRRVAALLGGRAKVATRSGPIRFDWADTTTWEPALTGVHAAYVVDSQGPDAGAEVAEFAALATARGVRRLVLLSARVGQDLEGDVWLATERAVRASGTGWTILRPTWFAQNFGEDPLITDALRAGDLRLPTGEGREPFIDAEDIAEVAVAALTGEGHAGQVYELSGPAALTWGEAVAEVARATGDVIRYTPLDEDTYRAESEARGVTGDHLDLMVALFAHIREGRAAHLSDGVRRVLGREPRPFAAHAATLGSLARD
ncbi:NAD(P)H-binding protein [Streptomyces avicenniae]|uniref:NAD(P)H-binding protein n=1 Tax=Streptomyces avicenniae TaxID=500153 RepID=UPI00069B45A5|nr:NAD(P)H-binding protein [Streptomyces avicenniae]